jgi:hypothetical protein
MVLGISFVETPLKFRAPGMTVALGVAIGRLVFRALNVVEAVFAAVLIGCLLVDLTKESGWMIGLVAAVTLVLLAGALIVRPAMDRRVRRDQISEGLPRNHLHLWYVGLEMVKVVLLIAIGVTGFAASAA